LPDVEQDAPVSVIRPAPLLTITLGLLTAIGPFSLDAYLPALPEMARELGVSAPTIQLSLTACLIGLGVGQLIAGPLGDRFGRRRPILIGIGAFTLASIGCALAPSAELLLVWRAVQGLSGAAGVVLARAAVKDVTTEESATKIYSQMAVISGIAPVIAPVIGAAVFGAFGWRAVFIFLAVLGAVLFVIVVVILGETQQPESRVSAHPREVFRGYLALLRDWRFRSFMIVSALMSATLFTYISSSPFVIQGVFGLDALAFALIFGGNGLGLSIAGLINARLVSRHNPAKILRVASCAQVIGLVVLTTSILLDATGIVTSAGLFIAALFMTIVPLGFMLPIITAFAMSRGGDRAGSASALLGVGSFAVGGLVSPLTGLGDPAILMAIIMLVSGAFGCMAAWRATGVPQ
jgi:DHA1 family bicyclomycin/chloramphenicol resistance-like MFS transporter